MTIFVSSIFFETPCILSDLSATHASQFLRKLPPPPPLTHTHYPKTPELKVLDY